MQHGTPQPHHRYIRALGKTQPTAAGSGTGHYDPEPQPPSADDPAIRSSLWRKDIIRRITGKVEEKRRIKLLGTVYPAEKEAKEVNDTMDQETVIVWEDNLELPDED